MNDVREYNSDSSKKPSHSSLSLTSEIPSRSRLYSLAPLGVGTAWVESLTSYTTRLAWTYRINPRILVAQEVLPSFENTAYLRTSPSTMNAFFRSWSARINGTGEQVLSWVTALEQLTMRSDLRYLVLRAFTDGFPSRGLPRETPAWCPACYQQWMENGCLLYQPLMWTLKCMEICPLHRRRLEERCPFCSKHQSALATKAPLGSCTQCGMWLGTTDEVVSFRGVDGDMLAWQQWVLNAVEELHRAAVTRGPLPWEKLPAALTSCLEVIGAKSEMQLLTTIHRESLTNWISGATKPSFRRLLDLCYTFKITPLQLITQDRATLKNTLHDNTSIYQRPQPAIPRHSVDRKHASALIQSVLDGREEPLGVRQIERRLGLGHGTIARCFPHECILITDQYRAQRTQQAKRRVAQVREEVRRVVFTLHERGSKTGTDQVKNLLSNPNTMRTPEALTIWHATRRELGIEEAY